MSGVLSCCVMSYLLFTNECTLFDLLHRRVLAEQPERLANCLKSQYVISQRVSTSVWN